VDEHNLDHATKRLTAEEIEQAIWNAPRIRASRRNPGRAIVALVPNGVRPITGWEARA
jgi:hypothetical protein